MFVDKIVVKLKAGDGGSGHVSFFRDNKNDRGGPDGGDGGRGGDIVFKATHDQNNLVNFYYERKYFAEDGEKGGKNNRSGKGGEDLIIKVPLGTIIRDAKTNNIIADMFYDGEEKRVLKGGMGGKGNAFFKTSRKQTPNFCQTGEKTIAYDVCLELKTIADIGLIGFPNVGKSTLLSVISKARPKIADYHFTTLSPNLGVVQYSGTNFVVADIPGLIEGASDGAGLGIEFLRHIERTRLLVHVIDISGIEERNPIEDYKKINEELKKYSQVLSKKQQIIALSKCDMLSEDDLKNKSHAINNKVFKDAVRISSATRMGIDQLLQRIVEALSKIEKAKPIELDNFTIDIKDKTSLKIERGASGEFICTGGLVNNLIRGVVLDDTESFLYFQRRIISSGIDAALKEKGVKEGDTVVIGDLEFDYIE